MKPLYLDLRFNDLDTVRLYGPNIRLPWVPVDSTIANQKIVDMLK